MFTVAHWNIVGNADALKGAISFPSQETEGGKDYRLDHTAQRHLFSCVIYRSRRQTRNEFGNQIHLSVTTHTFPPPTASVCMCVYMWESECEWVNVCVCKREREAGNDWIGTSEQIRNIREMRFYWGKLSSKLFEEYIHTILLGHLMSKYEGSRLSGGCRIV